MAPPPKDQHGRPAQAKSAFDLGSDDGGRRPTGQIPAQPARTTTGAMPMLGEAPPKPAATTAAPPAGAPAHAAPAGHGAPAPSAPPPPVAGEAARPAGLTTVQKDFMGSQFASGAMQRKRSSLLGTDSGTLKAVEEPEATSEYEPDGETPHPDLVGRDVWKAVKAPIQSREGKRSREQLELVLAQFAVAANPRYADDAPGKPRGHIFVWDVSRAMSCEIPHFVGARELTLAQTVDWLRHEGPMRGWSRVTDASIFEAAEAGYLVVAIPREVRLKHIAIVAPQQPQLRPLLSGAALKRGNHIATKDMFGVAAIDCFAHP
ncbi:MAG: hypothetical protein SFW67_22690 [Myxococcaceae bacterium]|nr:hypothetical protein [Myxococcaceae bacterium]